MRVLTIQSEGHFFWIQKAVSLRVHVLISTKRSWQPSEMACQLRSDHAGHAPAGASRCAGTSSCWQQLWREDSAPQGCCRGVELEWDLEGAGGRGRSAASSRPRAAPAPGNGGRQGAAEQGGRGGEPGGGHPGQLVRLSRAKCASWLRARFPQEILEVLPGHRPHVWKQTVLRQSPVGGDCFGGCEGRKAAQRR